MSDGGLDALGGWPGTHRAAGWRRRDGAEATAGDADRSFPLASVTKLLTATAVLVAVQEEILALDEPAGPPGSTVRLLLCHASGLPFDGRDPIAPPGSAVGAGPVDDRVEPTVAQSNSVTRCS